MTLINATSLNDQVDYLSANHSFADETLNSIFNVSPQNAVADDDDDDIDETIPDPDEDELYDENDDTFPDDDELGAIDDDDDAVIADDDDLDDDDDTGSVTSGLNNPSSFADRSQGRTTGRMIDHEPGSGL